MFIVTIHLCFIMSNNQVQKIIKINFSFLDHCAAVAAAQKPSSVEFAVELFSFDGFERDG